MPKHLKTFAVVQREEPNGYNRWILLNPEYANDDAIVARELEDLDAELEDLWSLYATNQPTHGFNGHDPYSYLDDHEYEWGYDYSYDECADYDYPDEGCRRSDDLRHVDGLDQGDDWSKVNEEETASTRAVENVLDRLEDPYSHLPFMQSMRTRRRPSRRPFVRDWMKTA